MTGFAAVRHVSAPHSFSWEIRSVNNRYLDVVLRLPDELRALEPALREDAAAQLGRGKVECSLKFSRAEAGSATVIDGAAVAQLRAWHTEIDAAWPGIAPPTAADVLRWPGVVVEPEVDTAALAGPVRESFAAALAELLAARGREGDRIATMLRQRLDAIRQLLTDIGPRLAATAPRHRERLLERVGRLGVDVQPDRLEQEVALLAQRADVAEEIDRLGAHLEEFADTMARSEPIGRRLDFLIQELNREANTFGSKVQDEELTRAAVDLKVLIEQMREQVQNLE